MNIQDVFFDLDRTLWDFDRNSHEALSIVFNELKLEQHIANPRAFISDYKRINDRMWADYRKGKISRDDLRFQRFHESLKKHGVDNLDLAQKYNEQYMDVCPKIPHLLPNALEILLLLQSRGKKLHIITNGFEEVQTIKLKHAGLDHFFATMTCSDTAGYSKPDKRIFESALNLAKAKATQSLMIGDQIEVDVLGANALGMQTILFEPKKQHKTGKSVTVVNDLIEISRYAF